MGVLNESEKNTPFSLTPGDNPSVDHDATPNSAGFAAPFHDDNELDDELPFLSVLNTVIDHCMMDPTPMEPKEFEKQLKVPVIRVFGPIVRGGNDAEPWQSCCLYIHGAFPYLLARPVAAGPDGSSTELSAGQGHVDWDSVHSVQAILPQLTDNLESMIQESLETSPSVGYANKRRPNKIIRSISVVVGRGFYTYCPGQAAPFLRVEYYDPKLRWKVKIMLERGLDLPISFHPDPQQYDQHRPSNTTTDTLTFHCYEAHIPYTMQFFKDWNLSGMSYIHLSSGGKFRTPLPKSHRPRTRTVSTRPSTNIFVQGNTDVDHIWEDTACCKSLSYDSREGTLMRQSSSAEASSQESNMMKREPVWCKKETSCDLEFDCTIDQIMNIRTVITSKGDDDSVQWRAVPSLREIWRQERRRMSLLLPPKDDFLSQAANPATPPFTLNVKQGASVPGTRLAVLGMKKLLRVSQGLEQEFDRAMKQIIHRYAEHVLRTDQMFSARKQCNPLLANVAHTQDSSAPDDVDALDALAALGGQFEQEIDVSGSEAGTGTDFPSLSQIPDDEYEECAVLFSQRVDRGEHVEESQYEHVEDYIDPTTLAPYDDFEDDEEEYMDEHEFEQALTVLENGIARKESVATVYPPNHSQPKSVDWSKAESSDESGYEDELKPGILNATPRMTRYSGIESTPTSTPRPTPCGPMRTNIAGTLCAPCILPPSRAQVESREATGVMTRCLYQLERHRSTPTWLIHTSRYMILRENLLVQKLGAPTWGPRWSEGKFVIASVVKPPSRFEVESWLKKQDRKSNSKRVSMSTVESKHRASVSKLTGVNLQMDDNSRQLTAAPSTSLKRRRVEFNGAVQEVEQVEWSTSQPMPSQSQSNSQKDTPSKPNGVADLLSKESSPEANHQCGNSLSVQSNSSNNSESQGSAQALDGIGQQGGRIYVEGGGGLKTKTKASPKSSSFDSIKAAKKKSGISSLDLPNPLTIMSIEIHVQCRTGRAGVHDSKEVAMRPNSEKDKVSAAVYVYARDPGGGETMQFLEKGCVFVPHEAELRGRTFDSSVASNLSKRIEASLPRATMGVSSEVTVEAVRDEKQLMLRLASIVRWKDPDMLLSWDTQGSGLGYLIERGCIIGKSVDTSTNSPSKKTSTEVDMARLLGRIPTAKQAKENGAHNFLSENQSEVYRKDVDKSKGVADAVDNKYKWKGSGLGAEWDERVGPGVAAASIVSSLIRLLHSCRNRVLTLVKVGRLVFSGWKLVAEEVKHPNSSYLPAMVSTVLGKRIPFHDDIRLTEWYAREAGRERWRTIQYRLTQAVASLLMLDGLDIVGRAGEAARLSGVEFSQSFPGIRGSQYKVEGVLLRALKSIQSDERGKKKGEIRTPGHHRQSLSLSSGSQTQSPWKLRRGMESKQTSAVRPVHNVSDRCYFFYSPGVNDTNNQEALECQALNLEPQSGIQADPVVVCDFTALYPSLVIAYNLCYSTIAGKLDYHSTRSEMRREGRTTGKLGPFLYSERRTATVLNHHTKSLVDHAKGGIQTQDDEKFYKDRAYAAPTGSIYVAESVLKGVLPQVLDEILSTRAMLKKAAKQYKKLVPNLSPAVLRQLEARQLALKYVANVTYGYTSATFSGRCAMPLLADTIVECGRRTLTNAMNLANTWGRDKGGRWYGAEVIYGDTDSVFVKLPGRTVREAFEFGEQFCNDVTASNPPPVQLKLEKVYLGSMMQTKKKYCGMKFESKDQKKPIFEAKGIETIRKDQCALTQKVLRNSLIALFCSGLDDVKSYLFRQWALILAGNLPVSDFILTGRVRSKYRGGRVGPVQAALARRLSEADPGRVVRAKERLAYVIVATPGVTFRLRDCVLTPMELLEQWDAFTIHSAYYITKHVNAALQRCLGLAPYHVNVNAWFESCPKPRKRIHHWPITRSGSNVMISSYFGSDICSLCGKKCRAEGSARAVVCAMCRQDSVEAATTAMYRLSRAQKESNVVASQCSTCNGCFEDASTFAVLKGSMSVTRSSLLVQVKTTPGIVTPIANCTCIDCPTTFERHRLREAELEAHAICKSLDLI